MSNDIHWQVSDSLVYCCSRYPEWEIDYNMNKCKQQFKKLLHLQHKKEWNFDIKKTSEP